MTEAAYLARFRRRTIEAWAKRC
ncbi:hypothetical protein RA210_U140094 [Rubrivivax sp. A210]|nr:hypothetical protein RA210_U140094 [Rubrivivax sp. A210]